MKRVAALTTAAVSEEEVLKQKFQVQYLEQGYKQGRIRRFGEAIH